MKNDLKILFLEDNPTDVMLIQKTLRKSFHFNASHASNREEFITQLFSFSPDIILSDHSLPQFDSLSALEIVKENSPTVPFILVTGSVSEEFAVRCIKSGAENYVLKDNLMRLPLIIENALSKRELETENSVIKSLNKKLENLYQLIAQKNKDITDSIVYSQRIQKAVLPNANRLQDYLPNSFILYKPKDIISGDFYWFSSHKDTIIMAVSDCTGHGVPGALLSITSCGFIKNSIYLKRKHTPADILNELNTTFCDIFSTGNEQSDPIYDGMDIAVCSYNKSDRTLVFSGAKRPLYILHDGELIEHKCSMQPIGYSYNARELYNDTHIKLEQHDRVYMFTDGFADQFGGNHGKKLKSSSFKTMLLKMKDIPMANQGTYLGEEFDLWRSGEQQTDDVLVMGFEVE